MGDVTLEVYAVRNREGKWFRAKGFGGYGATWVDDIRKAKLYANISQARSRVTFFASEWPEHGIPDLVRLRLTGTETAAEEVERVRKAVQKKTEKNDRDTIRRRKEELRRASEDIRRAQQRIAKLRAGVQCEP